MSPPGKNPYKKVMWDLSFFLQDVCPRRRGHCFSLVGIFEFCNNNALYYLNSNHLSLGCRLLKCHKEACYFLVI